MYTDSPNAVDRVSKMAAELVQNLKGFGAPRVAANGTADGTADGKSLADAISPAYPNKCREESAA
jgi:hypothetical protein